MGRAGMFFSILAIAAGAVMHWAVTASGHGFNVSTVGIILDDRRSRRPCRFGDRLPMSRRPVGSGKRTYDRQAIDTKGQSSEVHEEVHS